MGEKNPDIFLSCSKRDNKGGKSWGGLVIKYNGKSWKVAECYKVAPLLYSDFYAIPILWRNIISARK